MLDGAVVFTLLFGSDLFEDYIGNLAMAVMASSEMANDSDNSEKLQDRLKVLIWFKCNNYLCVLLFFSYTIREYQLVTEKSVID